jgi:arylsulfatase A-like enzyme
MAAMISRVDDGVGRIVDVLRETGRLDDTIIFFSSDNGPSAEERNWLGGEEIAYPGGSTGGLRGHKGSVFEGGIRVPGIWSWPAALPAGATCDVPAMMMDVTPTILSAAGLEPDADVDGTNLLPLLSGAEAESDRVLTWEYEGQLAVRRGRWKLVIDPADRLGAPQQPGRLLFDLAEDRNETRDLTAHQEAVLADLEKQASAWTETLGQWRRPPTE